MSTRLPGQKLWGKVPLYSKYVPPACKNNGTCFDTPGSYDCKCPPGYQDRNCEVRFRSTVSTSLRPVRTMGHASILRARMIVNVHQATRTETVRWGFCNNTVLHVPPEYKNNWTCVLPYDCKCPPGYQDRNCEVRFRSTVSTSLRSVRLRTMERASTLRARMIVNVHQGTRTETARWGFCNNTVLHVPPEYMNNWTCVLTLGSLCCLRLTGITCCHKYGQNIIDCDVKTTNQLNYMDHFVPCLSFCDIRVSISGSLLLKILHDILCILQFKMVNGNSL